MPHGPLSSVGPPLSFLSRRLAKGVRWLAVDSAPIVTVIGIPSLWREKARVGAKMLAFNRSLLINQLLGPSCDSQGPLFQTVPLVLIAFLFMHFLPASKTVGCGSGIHPRHCPKSRGGRSIQSEGWDLEARG